MPDTHADHIADVLYTWKRPLYYFAVPLDAWIVVLRPGFLGTAANFAAWEVDGVVRGVSDSAALKGSRNIAVPLPTMAVNVTRGMLETHGRPPLMSDGWTAACQRMSRLLDDCAPAAK